MTEKRFTLTFDDKIVDNLTGIIHEVHSGYDVAMDLSGLLNDLNDDNEQLKSIIKEVTELLSDEVDLFSDKATEHDLNAYMELNEFDNKDAFYMATATKKAIRMLKELQE